MGCPSAPPFLQGGRAGTPLFPGPCPAFTGPFVRLWASSPAAPNPRPRHSVWYQLVPSAPCSEDSQSQSKLVWGLPDQRGGGSPAQSPHLLGLKSRLRMCVL